MKIEDLNALIKTYEALAAKLAAEAKERAALAAKLGGSDKLVAAIDAFPDADSFVKFADKMPDNPPLGDVLAAFGTDLPDLAKLVNETLDGNAALLGVLAEKGCGRDPAKLKEFADTFNASPALLQGMIEGGGLGDNPDALAAMFDAGCGRDPAKLKTLFEKFPDPADRKALSDVLTSGGLGQAPAALGALAGQGDGDLLKKLTEQFDNKAKNADLNELLTRTSLDGGSPSRPELLRDLIVDGLGGEPKRLLELHKAFDGNIGDLDKVISGMDGVDGQAGKRLKTLMDAVQGREGYTDQQMADHLRDPFLSSIAGQSGASKTPPVGGDANAKAGFDAARTRKVLNTSAVAGLLAQGMTPSQAGAVLTARIDDSDLRDQFSAATGSADTMADRADALALLPAEGDPTQTDVTKAATTAVTDATTTINGQADGADAAQIAALMTLADKAIAAATVEPDSGARDAALAAAKNAANAAQTAMKRAAGLAMSASQGGAAAAAMQQASAKLPSTTPDAVKNAVKAYADMSFAAAATSAAINDNETNSGALATKALAEFAAKHGTPVPVDTLDASKAATKIATEAADDLAAVVTNASRPIPAGLLERAKVQADATVAAGQAEPDETTAKAAYAAAKKLSDAVSDALLDAAARLAMDHVRSNTDGKAALKNVAAADACSGMAARLLAPGSESSELRGSLADVSASEKTSTDVQDFKAIDVAVQKSEAEAAARQAAEDKKGAMPDVGEITSEIQTASLKALGARNAANTAAAKLDAAIPAENPAAFAALVKEAAEAADDAFKAAKNVVEDSARADTLIAAEKCAASVKKASERPAFGVLNAALDAQADLDIATKSARNAALTSVEVTDLLAADKAELGKAAESAAYLAAAAKKGAAPDATEVTDEITAANKAADDAKLAVTNAIVALAGGDPAVDAKAYTQAIKDLAAKADAALSAARDAVDETKRDAALAEAKKGAAEAATATKTLADYHLQKAKEASFKKQDADMRNAAGPRDAMTAAMASGVGLVAATKKAGKAFETGKAAVANAAASALALLAETDGAVRSATELAEEKQAKAQLPGADQLAKLEAMVADRDAAKVLAEKAKAAFCGAATSAPWGGLVGALPAAAPATTDPMPPNVEVDFQDALTAGKAASSAFVAARDAALKVERSALAFKVELTAIANPTTAESDALSGVTTIEGNASAATVALQAPVDQIAAAIKAAKNSINKYMVWANTNHSGDTGTLALQATSGFIASEFADTNVPAVGEADLIRVAPSLVKQPYTGAHLTTVVVNGANATVDMKHITERHVRGTYEFDNESCPKGTQHDVGMLLQGALAGLQTPPKTTEENRLIKESRRNKANSFFPEAVDSAKAEDLAKQALTAADNSLAPSDVASELLSQIVPPPTPPATTPKEVRWNRTWFSADVTVSIPPNISANIGIGIAQNPGGPVPLPTTAVIKGRMFYPNEGDKISTPDVLIMAKALGVAQ